MRARIILLLSLLLCLIGAIYLVSQTSFGTETTNSSAATGEAAIGGPFTLTDQNGQTVTDQTYRGRYMLLQFGFASCPDICPTQLAMISAALDQLGEKANRIAPLFVSVDPERDTPDALKSYIHSFPRFTALTGTPEQVAAIAAAYKVYYQKVPNPAAPEVYTMDHSIRIFLMDPEGRFVQLFDRQPPAALAAALEPLIK